MLWEIEYLEEVATVFITYSGTGSSNLFKRSFEEAAAIALRHGARRFLVTTRDYEFGLTAGEIYDFPKAFDRMMVERKTRFAVIMPTDPTGRKNFTFFKTVCRNRGYVVKLFDDKDSALEWLTS